ncbi:MAG: PIN domain-containing protein [Planctomycetota bacterium]|nr:PIN domain-containing protein [Planctomycetota bacterium]MDA1140177.1 PIN domain-containing protein [Planctomycetota bacterium]
MKYLLDTDTCIFLLRGHNTFRDRVAQEGVSNLAISIPTVAELFYGAHNSPKIEHNLAQVRSFLSHPAPVVLTIDSAAAELFGEFKADLRRSGQPIGDMDLLIAAVASVHDLIVVTNNTAHFRRIPNINFENWVLSD